MKTMFLMNFAINIRVCCASAFDCIRSLPMRALNCLAGASNDLANWQWDQLCWALHLPLRITTIICILAWAFWQLFATNIAQNFLNHSYHMARCVAWPKLSRRCGVAYPKPLTVAKPPDIDVLEYAMRHAMTAYPPRMLVALGELSARYSLPFTTTDHVLKHCFDIDPVDIVDFERGQTPNQPFFYLAVDRNKERIVVSVRGTVPSNVFDVLTDLDAKPMDYSVGEVHGVVHQGMSLSAKYVLDAIRRNKKARDLLFANREFNVIFCGHSLGAGVAALMAMRVLNGESSVFADFVEVRKIKTFAFASPGVASLSLFNTDNSRKWNDVVTTVALSTDLVTRISMRSYLTHIERCECISNWEQQELFLAETEGNTRGEWLIATLQNTGESDGEMFPLGTVLWYVPDHSAPERQCAAALDEVRQRGQNFEVVNDYPKNKELHTSGIINTTAMYFCAAMPFMTPMVKMLLWILSFFVPDIDRDDLSASKLKDKYNARRYQLCDATPFRKQIFQNLILDVESLHAHFPNRYLWACGVTLKQN